MLNVIVELEGVLQGTFNKDPIPEGVLLTGALSAFNKITFITNMSEDNAYRWLNENKIVDFDLVLGDSVQLEGESLKERQLKYLRAKNPVGLFITSDPDLWAFAFELGITSIMFGQPSYLDPGNRPNAPSRMRSWTMIEEQVKKDNERRTQKARQSRSEGVRFE